MAFTPHSHLRYKKDTAKNKCSDIILRHLYAALDNISDNKLLLYCLAQKTRSSQIETQLTNFEKITMSNRLLWGFMQSPEDR